jgi:hypothetical protein
MPQQHPSFGPVPPEAFRRAINAPAGRAIGILRQFAPSFGVFGSAPNRTFKVKMIREMNSSMCATIEVQADDAEHAEEIALSKAENDAIEWDDNYDGEQTGIFVDGVTEIQEGHSHHAP